MIRTKILASTALAGLLLTPRAHADTNKIAAEALFQEGRRLMLEGKFPDACPKFADSERLDPSPGTLLNLASCYEKWGRIASAWATYQEGASMANATHRADLLETAERHAAMLLPRLPRVTVAVPHPEPNLELRRDGDKVSRAEWGVPIPVDPGTHTFAATAPQFHEWKTEVTASKEGELLTVTVPSLEALPPAPEPPPAPPKADLVAASPAASAPHGGSGLKVAAVTLGATGLVSLGVAGVFTLLAKNENDSSLQANGCDTSVKPNVCVPTAFDHRTKAQTYGTVASVTVAAGAALAATGVVLWLVAPSNRQEKPLSVAVVPTLGGAMLRGEW